MNDEEIDFFVYDNDLVLHKRNLSTINVTE